MIKQWKKGNIYKDVGRREERMISINVFEDITSHTLNHISNILSNVEKGDELELNIAPYAGKTSLTKTGRG